MTDIRSLNIRIRTVGTDDGVHVMMGESEHETASLDCWCSPRYLLPCDECEGNVGCWKCSHGTISLTREQAEHAAEPLVISHNR